MSKHTPGPWELDSVSSEALHDIILGYQIPGAGHPILLASVYDDDEPGPGRFSSQEAEANAHLIAAAPDLLAALKKIIEMNRQHAQDQYGNADDAEGWACVVVAREAIAKAEGT